MLGAHRMPVQILAAPLSIQTSDNIPGNAADGLILESLPPKWETWMKFLTPGFDLATVAVWVVNQWMEYLSFYI